MCPNHVEQFIDAKLVKSTRLSERLDLWQKYARNPIVSRHTIERAPRTFSLEIYALHLCIT